MDPLSLIKYSLPVPQPILIKPKLCSCKKCTSLTNTKENKTNVKIPEQKNLRHQKHSHRRSSWKKKENQTERKRLREENKNNHAKTEAKLERKHGHHHHVPKYVITMRQTVHQLNPAMPPTVLQTYNGEVGPLLLDVIRNQPIQIKWRNRLPKVPLLPVDYSMHGADPRHPAVRTSVHMHGGEQSAANDGHPLAWFTPGESRTLFYPLPQQPTFLFFHDHADAITRLNVRAGLFNGVMIIRQPDVEEPLNLPSGEFETAFAIADTSYNADGQSIFVNFGVGDILQTNGLPWPYMNIQPRKYRFRLLNASAYRTIQLRLSYTPLPTGPKGPGFWLIATDGGYIASPVLLNDPLSLNPLLLTLMPAERVTVIIDFAGIPVGTDIFLINTGEFDGSGPPDPTTVGQVMKFTIVPLVAPDTSAIAVVANFVPLSLVDVVKTRQINILYTAFNDMFLFNNIMFGQPCVTFPVLYTTEIWEFVNAGFFVTHPLHLHLTQFVLLNRQAFDKPAFLAAYNAVNAGIPFGEGQIEVSVTPFLVGPVILPQPQEISWKDVISSPLDFVTRIVVRWAPQENGTRYPFDPTLAPGYVFHCHQVCELSFFCFLALCLFSFFVCAYFPTRLDNRTCTRTRE